MSYQIVYLPEFTGRAEPAVLLLEDAGVPYELTDDGKVRLPALAVEHPVFAPPVLIDGTRVLSQTSVIAEYLGDKHGYDVAGEHRIAAAQLAYNLADIWEETYVGRKENDTVFFAERFPRWVTILENSFRASSYFFSEEKPTYVDFLALNIFTLAEYCWGKPAADEFESKPTLWPWVQRMLARPRIRAYFDNPDSLPVCREALRAA